MKTQEEIIARCDAVAADDWMGFRREVLSQSLDYEHVKPFLKDGVTEETWLESAILTDDALLTELKRYLEFAVGKALDHRGISASRSIDKLSEMVWLLGRDDLAEAMQAGPYAKYGCPGLLLLADAIEYHPAEMETDAFKNMAAGRSCRGTDGCWDGCRS